MSYLTKKIVLYNKSLRRCFQNYLLSCIYTSAHRLKAVDLAYNSYDGDNSKPPLMILHGLFGSKNNWNSLSKAISKDTGRTVIAVDARNHGESPHLPEHTYHAMSEDVLKLMDTLNLNSICLMGHSMGGRTAMLFSILNPSKVTKLIVVDISPVVTSPNLYTLESIFDLIESVKIPKNTSMVQARKLADQQLTALDVSTRNFILTNLKREDTGEFTWRINVKTLRDNFKSNIAVFPNEGTAKYEGPTLFIGGENSDFIGKGDLPKMKNFFPNANLVFIPNAGHWVHSEQPQKFLNHVNTFIKESS